MIASDRVRLDGLIRQWRKIASEQRTRSTELDKLHRHQDSMLRYFSADVWDHAANELEAALLVLGDARPQEEK